MPNRYSKIIYIYTTSFQGHRIQPVIVKLQALTLNIYIVLTLNIYKVYFSPIYYIFGIVLKIVADFTIRKPLLVVLIILNNVLMIKRG